MTYFRIDDLLYCTAAHNVNNRTAMQLPLTASHPPLGCRAFIACTNLRYAVWVTMHLKRQHWT